MCKLERTEQTYYLMKENASYVYVARVHVDIKPQPDHWFKEIVADGPQRNFGSMIPR